MRNKKFSTNGFVKRALLLHGNKYDYSKVVYTKATEKVEIICPTHGPFMMTPNSHLSGQGCPACGMISSVNSRKLSKNEFVKRSKEIHGEKYDYTNVVYINNHTPVSIICPIHGEFQQKPTQHLCGCGCQQCGVIKKITKKTLTTDAFVKKAIEVHGNDYSYDNTIYINHDIPILIKCNKCGKEFYQTPTSHLNGRGCLFCHRSKGEEIISKYLDSKNIQYIPQYKIKSDLLFSVKKFFVDFYIPSYNIIIEYNGEQHYKPKSRWGGKNRFLEQQERDMALRQYCKEHKIKLVEISYNENNNIEKILNKILNKHKL